MKVLFTTHAVGHGGAELFLRDVLAEGKAGTENWDCLFFQDGPIVAEIRALGRRAAVEQAGDAALSLRRGSGPLEVLAAGRAIFRLVRRLKATFAAYDVVVANSQKALFLSGLAAALARRPFVWILHDIVTDASFRPVNRWAIVATTRLFARVVAVNSEATRRAFVGAGGAEASTRIVHNGFRLDAPPADDAERARLRGDLFATLGLDPSRPLAGVFSRLSQWKGQHVFLRAVAKTSGLQALVVGDDTYEESGYKDDLFRLTRELGIEGRVRFLGFRPDVAALMAAVDVVVHCSTQPEPFGRVVVEGMLAGRPVIATDGGGVNEIVTDGVDGLLVPPGDAAALAAALGRLTADEGFAAALAREGAASARRRFGIDATIARLREIFDEVSPSGG